MPIFWNSDADTIGAANDTITNCDQLTAKSWIYGLNGEGRRNESPRVELG